MNSLLVALILLLLLAPPAVAFATREVRFRRRFRRMMKAHRDGYQRFLLEHPKV